MTFEEAILLLAGLIADVSEFAADNVRATEAFRNVLERDYPDLAQKWLDEMARTADEERLVAAQSKVVQIQEWIRTHPRF